jgi:hypothetical protein
LQIEQDINGAQPGYQKDLDHQPLLICQVLLHRKERPVSNITLDKLVSESRSHYFHVAVSQEVCASEPKLAWASRTYGGNNKASASSFSKTVSGTKLFCA